MINKIIAFSINQKIIIGFLIIILIIAGIYSAVNLPVDAVPDITNNQIQIITSSPTLSAAEVERFITYPVEISMKSLPDLVELRSISKFGISVVTVVFEDNVETYFARNLVFQKLKEAQENIPPVLGKPEMAPVSTGLGEIYQYIVRNEIHGDAKYSDMELRTIQDWIVKKQLLGTEGVADVMSFGGFEQQLHILVNPESMQSYNINLQEVYESVISNNSNTGGGSIEILSDQYSIRGIGIIENLKDIENIVVKTEHGIPVFLKQIAEVKSGNGLRVGGVTQDGKGEAVAGIVLMLKGANSREVAENVHKKISEIIPVLPEGVTIDEFYNRENLIDKTIQTVKINLIEGGLIVILVLVLLLGNIRAGFIVASVIPLSMMFAVIMMYIFNVSGNLMSLGAIDFGLIVDGAVIIVESVIVAVTAKIHLKQNRLDKNELDETVYSSSTSIIKSAIFGVLIILVVYLPIFALGGIEGKMFKPMAFTVGFALIGALILSVTYVPMMCSLILNRNIKEKKTFADRFIDKMKRLYIPSLEYALNNKILTISVSVVILAVSLIMFSKTGGEFIPKLDEGDLAYQIVRLPGISLKESMNIGTKLEQILMKKFPEVKTVVTKTGAPELATDPMGPEFSDVIVILKPKDEWTSAKTKEELIEKIHKELSVVPGIGLSFTQPIELRFNELIAGARGDISVKIFGDDLSILSDKGNEAAVIMGTVKGAEDISVQQIEGLPQLQIKIDREKIALHGINVDDVNNVIEASLAGKKSGVVFDGDRKSDIVIKFSDEFKKNIDAVKSILVVSSDNQNIPLAEISQIEVKEGPAEISRDNGKRRIVVQGNVRSRDIESFVTDLKSEIAKKLKLPPGYTIEYGGQFENLVSAGNRLLIAVPVSLFFIFALLFVAFNSIKQGLLVFSGIPFAVVGGIFALAVRDMPFSISAGIGFIALFGVAVLNGIVMISYLNLLESEGISDVHERIIKGTSSRLRPILMTAMVASFGFIPMAISTGAGAEVQRPLATVVIGGLISSTLLTLIVLPVLYGIFSKHKKNSQSLSKILTVLVFLILPASAFTQTKTLTKIDDVIRLSAENNQQIKSALLNIEKEKSAGLKSINIPKPEIFLEYEGIKGSIDNYETRKFGIKQDLEFPLVYSKRSTLQNSEVNIVNAEYYYQLNNLKSEIKLAYYNLLLHNKLLQTQKDNLILNEEFLLTAKRKYEAGAAAAIEELSAKVNKIKIENEIKNLESEIYIIKSELNNLLNGDYQIDPSEELKCEELSLSLDEAVSKGLSSNPEIVISNLRKDKFRNKLSLSESELLPDIFLKYFNQKILGQSGYWGFEVGLGIPLWFWWEPSGKIKESGYELKIAENDDIVLKEKIKNEITKIYADYENNLRQLRFLRDEALKETDEILSVSKYSYESGAISYTEYLQSLNLVNDTRMQYYNSVYNYNSSIFKLENIIGGNIK